MTFTKEQLFEKLQHRIAVAAKYPDLEEAQLDAAIFKIALASLEAEPVGEFYHEKQGGWYQISEGDKVSDNRRITLYAAPVLPKQPGLLSIGELLHRLEEQTGEKWVEESAQPIIPERLIQAINRLLDNDGSRGCFDALEQHRAKTELELLLAAAQQNEPQNIPENIPEQPVSELRARAISLYKPPFKFDFGYIWDADGQMVADQNLNEDGQILRVRGWGRISYLENPEALQDEVGEVIALALSNYWNLHIAADLIQPVSEPYKLEIDMDDADHFSITHLHEIIYGKELIWPEAKLLARFMLDVKQRVSAAPAQESE